MTGLVTVRCSSRTNHPGRHVALSVPSQRRHSGLVESDPELDQVPELSEAEVSVLLEPVLDLLAQPAAPLVQGLGQVPVVERHGWAYPGIN